MGIERISTDPCASVSSVKSVFYPTISLSVLIEDAWRCLNDMGKKPLRPDYSIILDWIKNDSSVLDLGCHDGELLSLIVKEKNARAQGIEIDEQASYKCVELGLSVSQQDIDNGLSEYGDESFDYVILNQSIQQVKKSDMVMKEALRVGKEVIVGFPNFAHYSSRFQIFFRDYCKRQDIRIKRSAYIGNNVFFGLLPNLFAQTGLFLISK